MAKDKQPSATAIKSILLTGKIELLFFLKKKLYWSDDVDVLRKSRRLKKVRKQATPSLLCYFLSLSRQRKSVGRRSL
jgi:hypothetical protein